MKMIKLKTMLMLLLSCCRFFPALSQDSCTVSAMLQMSPDPVCSGETASFSAANANGGSGNSYQWTVNGNPSGSDSTFSTTLLSDGDSVAVIITNHPSCPASSSDTAYVIVNVIEINANSSSTMASCDSANGTIDITGITGGDPPYSFSLNGSASQSDSSFSNVPAGQHVVTVTDQNGCEETVTVNVPNSNSMTDASYTVTAETCGANDGSISIDNVTGGTAPYQFDLNNGLQSTSSTFPVVFQNLSSGTYTVVITDDSSCTYTINGIYVDLTGEIENVPYSTIPANCGKEDGAIIIDENNITGGQAPFEHALDGAAFQNDNTFSGLGAGTYALITQDDNGCSYEYTATITEPEKPESTFSIEMPPCGENETEIALEETTGGTKPYSYAVNGSSEDPGQQMTFGPYEAGEQVIIITSDANNCTDTDTLTVESDPSCDIVPLNIFSPNGDGIEDTWRIVNIESYPDNEVYVFNRWGQRVYHKEGYENNDGWDGKYLGASLPVATYYFIIDLYKDDNGKMVREKGAISIIK